MTEQARADIDPGLRPLILRTALLVLLAERRSHGYDLSPRLAEVGLRPDRGGLYRTLRTMERRGEVCSSWDTSPWGPSRRVYSLTDAGHAGLEAALAGMEAQRATIGRLLHRSRGPAGAGRGQ